MSSPKRRSCLPGFGGFSAACRAKFSDRVPASPRRVGVSTCNSSAGMPILSGSLVLHSSTTVSTNRTLSRRGRKKKVVRRRVFELGRHTGVDEVRVAHDHRLLGLTENVAQGNGRDAPAADEVGKYVPRADARQLIGVADEHKAAARTQRRKQRTHQQRSTIEVSSTMSASASSGSFFAFGERHLAGLVVEGHAEHAVDGLRVAVA